MGRGRGELVVEKRAAGSVEGVLGALQSAVGHMRRAHGRYEGGCAECVERCAAAREELERSAVQGEVQSALENQGYGAEQVQAAMQRREVEEAEGFEEMFCAALRWLAKRK